MPSTGPYNIIRYRTGLRLSQPLFVEDSGPNRLKRPALQYRRSFDRSADTKKLATQANTGNEGNAGYLLPLQCRELAKELYYWYCNYIFIKRSNWTNVHTVKDVLEGHPISNQNEYNSGGRKKKTNLWYLHMHHITICNWHCIG